MDIPAWLQQEQALDELERFEQGRHPVQETPLMRFTQCPDWQKAAAWIYGALHADRHQKGGRLPAPPGWLPPV